MNWKLNCVLLIDDDEPTNFFTRTILEDSGIVNHIRVTAGAKDALEFLEDNRHSDLFPELIFLDVNMPVMDAWEFIHEYEKMHLPATTIILMLTSALLPVDQDKVNDMELISGIEYKPLSSEKFQNILETHFIPRIDMSA